MPSPWQYQKLYGASCTQLRARRSGWCPGLSRKEKYRSEGKVGSNEGRERRGSKQGSRKRERESGSAGSAGSSSGKPPTEPRELTWQVEDSRRRERSGSRGSGGSGGGRIRAQVKTGPHLEWVLPRHGKVPSQIRNPKRPQRGQGAAAQSGIRFHQPHTLAGGKIASGPLFNARITRFTPARSPAPPSQ